MDNLIRWSGAAVCVRAWCFRAVGVFLFGALAGRAFAQAPSISLHPTNQHAAVGNTVSFAVSATGAAPLVYRWYLNGGLLADGGRFSGTRSNVLTLISARTNDGGTYQVTVSNASGVTPSQPASLTLHEYTLWPAGVVALWAGEGNANDSIGANHGVPYNGVSYTPGWLGRAFQFDSLSSEFVQFYASPVVDLSQMPNWTLTAWVKPSGINVGSGLTVYSEGQNYASLGVDVYYWSAVSTVNYSNLYSAVTVPSNNWTHLAVVCTPTTRSLFVNGVKSATGGNPYWPPYWNLAYLGGLPGQYFDGLIDEVSIYNRALSDAEVRSVYWPGISNMPPLVLQHPAGQNLNYGDTLNLSANVVGSTPMTYQWRKDNSDLVEGGRISGSKTAQLTISSLQPVDAGSYTLALTNIAGSTNSQAAAVTVQVAPPVITTQPQSLTATQGTLASFFVTASSVVPMTFQWRLNGNPLANGGQFSGVTTTNLQIANVVPTNAGSYSVLVSNVGGSTSSIPATLTVTSFPPVITAQTISGTLGSGAKATFFVTATGGQPLSYQWRFNGVNLTNGGQFNGVTASTMTVSNLTTNNTGNYAAVVTNGFGAVTSAAIALTVKSGPVITESPASQVAKVGDTVSFNVTASGAAPLTYRWRFNTVPISRATNTSLVLTNVDLPNAGLYDVIVSNASGFAISAPASLGFMGIQMYAGLVITGPTGSVYRVDYSPALSSPPDWQPLATVTISSNPYVFIDFTSPGAGQRFYRAVPQ